MKRFYYLLPATCYLLPALFIWLFLSPVQAVAGHLSSIDLIEQAYRNGNIGYSDALNYKVSAILRPDSLPAIYRSKGIIKSATPIITEARLNKHLLSTLNKRILAKGRVTTLTDLYGTGVILQSYVSPGKHFRLHYTLDNINGDAVPADDIDGNCIPDYVERFAEILDNVWTWEVEVMGYDAPPSDETEGGDCLLDVYLADLQAYGFTQIDEFDPASMVYMIFENDFAGFPPNTDPEGQVAGDMKVVAAHEFFHTIQFQISEDLNTNGWWMEASATWMEDYVYPEVNDYINYIDYWFHHPNLPLDTYSTSILFPYGTTIWIKHMTEKYGSKFVYDVWKKIKDGAPNVSALSAVTEALADRGTTLDDELKELRTANVTMTYEDASWYQLWQTINTSPDLLPIVVEYSDNNPDFSSAVKTYTYNVNTFYPLSAKYYSFSAPQGSGYLTLDFDGAGNTSVMVIGFHTDGGYDVTEVSTDPVNNDGSIIINSFSSAGPYSRVVVIPLNYSDLSSSSFTLTVSYSTGSAGSVSSLEIKPATTSLVTGDNGINGKQQYYLIIRNSTGNQILEDSISWGDDSPFVNINDNGLSVASNAPADITITATVQTYSSGAKLYASNPAIMSPGSPRLCTTETSNNINCSPTLTPIGSKSVVEESNLNFTLSAVDPEGAPITYNATDLPSGSTLNTSTGVFNWTPNNIQAGTYNIVFTVSDGSQSTSEVVTITVSNKGSNDSRCFIATAAFGSPLHPYVGLLREFRDSYMLTNSHGKWLVTFYYNNSPPVAEIVRNNLILKAIVKIFLIPAIIISWVILKLTLSEKIFIAVLMAVFINTVGFKGSRGQGFK